MAHMPCLNPSCSSHGQPHPNCRCYARYAEGGAVGHYCSSNRAHEAGCQYFAKGGPVEDSDSLYHVLAHGAARLLGGGLHSGFRDTAHFHEHAAKGRKRIESHLKALMDAESGKYEHKKHGLRDKLKKYLETGGLTRQLEAPHPIPDQFAAEMPAQAAALGNSKGQVYNYLNNQRPIPHEGLPFDKRMSNPDAERRYNRALDVAAEPLGVLGHVQNGTILPEHVQHLKGMFPELHDHLSKRLTEGLLQQQIGAKRPSYKRRQALALFLGADLDSTMTPPMIQAAQTTFQKAAGTPPGAPQGQKNQAGGQSKLRAGEKIAAAYKTDSQAAADRKLQGK